MFRVCVLARPSIVPSGSCVRTRRSQAALMAKFAKFKRQSRLNFTNFAMRAAWLRAISHTTPARHYTFALVPSVRSVGSLGGNRSIHSSQQGLRREAAARSYSNVQKKNWPENSRKFRKILNNGRAPRAKRAAHAHFWDFSDFLESSGFFFHTIL